MSTQEMDSLRHPDGSLEIGDNFCYLGNVVSRGDSCSECRAAGGKNRLEKFRDLLQLLAMKVFYLRREGT